MDEIKNTRNAKSIKNIKKNNITLPAHFRKWFENNYEITDNKKDIVTAGDLYYGFIKTKFYRSLTKNEKKIYNKKYFLILLSEELFFIEYFRDRYNNIRSVLQFWKKKENILADETETIEENNGELQAEDNMENNREVQVEDIAEDNFEDNFEDNAEDIEEDFYEDNYDFEDVEFDSDIEETGIDYKKYNKFEKKVSIYEYIGPDE